MSLLSDAVFICSPIDAVSSFHCNFSSSTVFGVGSWSSSFSVPSIIFPFKSPTFMKIQSVSLQGEREIGGGGQDRKLFCSGNNYPKLDDFFSASDVNCSHINETTF